MKELCVLCSLRVCADRWPYTKASFLIAGKESNQILIVPKSSCLCAICLKGYAVKDHTSRNPTLNLSMSNQCLNVTFVVINMITITMKMVLFWNLELVNLLQVAVRLLSSSCKRRLWWVNHTAILIYHLTKLHVHTSVILRLPIQSQIGWTPL